MATLYQPSNPEYSDSKLVCPEDQDKGFTLEELEKLVGKTLDYIDISDEYIMIIDALYQRLKYGGYNAIATKIAYNAFGDGNNKPIFGFALCVEDSEIDESLKIREEKVHE